MQDFFPTMMMKPNDSCDDYYCRLRQKEHKEALALNPVVAEAAAEQVAVVHEENEWGIKLILKHLLSSATCKTRLGISLVDESEPVDDSRARVELAPGIHAAYDLPADIQESAGEEAQVDSGLSLEELMAQMKSIWNITLHILNIWKRKTRSGEDY